MTTTSRGSAAVRIAAVAMTIGATVFAAIVPACSGPFDSNAEKLKKPTKKPRPPDAPVAAATVVYDEDCKTKFEEDNTKVHPNVNQANGLIKAGDDAIASVDHATDDAAKAQDVVDAIMKYRNALLANPWSGTATYRLAVAYALVRKKGCSIALLKRLVELQKFPDYHDEALRMAKSVDGEPAFKGFSKAALDAVGM
jgi:hypothetical protein